MPSGHALRVGHVVLKTPVTGASVGRGPMGESRCPVLCVLHSSIVACVGHQPFGAASHAPSTQLETGPRNGMAIGERGIASGSVPAGDRIAPSSALGQNGLRTGFLNTTNQA